MNISVYNKLSGKIEKICFTNEPLLQLSKNEDYIEGNYNDSEYYIENGIPIKMPPKEFDYQEFDYVNKVWYDARTYESESILVKSKRDYLLVQSDWTQLPDVPESTKQLWVPYRQALRDITSQEGYPFNIIWPKEP